jgi:type I restriction enzyme S subunit
VNSQKHTSDTGWPLIPLSEVFSIARGGSPRPIERFLTDDVSGVNWIMIGDASASSKYIRSTKKRIIKDGISRSRMVKPGDFLLTNSMSFGRPYIMETTGCIHDGWLVLSPREQDVSADFFYHLLGSNFVTGEFKRLAAGATVKNLNIDLVKGVKVPLPPLAEQRRIAEILDRAEMLRATRRTALAQLDYLTQSIFLDLFGDPISNPKGWPLIALQDCTSKIQIGPFGSLLHQEDYVSGGIALVNPKHIQNGRIVASHTESVTLRKFQDLQSFHLQVGDIVMGRRGEMGRCAIVEKEETPLLCGTGSLFIRADRIQTESLFLCAMLSSKALKRTLERLSLGQTLPNLNSRIVEQLSIPLPPLALQREFARRVAAVEKLKTTQRASLAELDVLFASLQHRAFRGEL